MSDQESGKEYYISKNRLENLVDGIFAFAMTLLVLGLDPPSIPKAQAATGIPPYIANLFPEFLFFVIAFLVLASFWLEHHRQFHFVRTVDPVILWLNIIILISIVFIPFSTDLAGDYDRIQSAVVIFHINLLIIGVLFLVHWSYLTKSYHLADPNLDSYTKIRRFWGLVTIPVCALLGIAVSFISPPDSFYAYLLIPLLVIIFLRAQKTEVVR